MDRTLEQSSAFRRSYKKLSKNQFQYVNAAIRAILAKPDVGELKKGDLSNVWVYKFQVMDLQFLMAYEFDEDNILLLALNTHENFYRNLKKSRR